MNDLLVDIIYWIGSLGTVTTMVVLTAIWMGVGHIVRSRPRPQQSNSSVADDVLAKTLSATTLGTTEHGLVKLAAGIGGQKPAASDQTTIVLRPTVGFRIVSIGLTCGLFYFPLSDPEMLFFASPYTVGAILASSAYVAIWTNLFELRYDQKGVSFPNWFFIRRNYAWKDLEMIRDKDSCYLYFYFNGRRTFVHKHLAGMDEFLTLARSKIAD